MNDDDIPELYLKKTDYENNLEDDVIATINEVSVEEDLIGFVVGDISYIEKKNGILASGNYGGNTQHNRLISIREGVFEDIEIDEDGEDNKKLQQFLTNEKARSVYSLPAYDESEIAEKLVKMGNDIQDEDETRSAGILLREGEVKKIDLNGGEEEEISCQYYEINDETGQLDIFVNGENVFRKTQSGEFGAPLSGSIQVIDANIKDPYKEIYYLFTGEDDEIMGMGFLHYNEKEKIKEYAMNMDDWDGEFYRSWDEIIQSDGSGTLYFNMDTPFMNSSFGQYLVEVEGILDSKGFRIENKPTYLVIEDYLEGLGGYYELQTPVTLYADYNGEDTREKISVGTKFRAISIHPLRNKRNRKGVYGVEADLYVQIETTDRKKGWIYFPKDSRTYDENDILVITPGWG
ncbi:MAG: hypothetical protein IJ682_09655 [Lachnospiraceae bacterium]|nr:hypothetical protein [Lachnospiraceae bacterium]